MPPGGKVAKRLSWYWQVEIANAALVPAGFVIIAYLNGARLGWPTFAALVPGCGLLIIGGLYWRGKLHALQGDKAALDKALAVADRFDRPLLLLTIAACLLAAAGFIPPLRESDGGERWAVLIAALLALAEYVNYYHRQLQHFDNWPDFQRLITGRGFRPAKMAVDLAAWRAARQKRQAA
ncbi:hypothetical protein [Erythrobacter sanguineus]|uniref:Uncharacterized protein n=2 Tax=Erythrobacter sanguineus TaxID=198312 RepID=A0A1M7SIV7_9SPHN|nr:hypothetical protein [Erythrobacter sanguineus]SHN58373.1 hypothetical protein SAMN02745193_01810 [Erythrobacter sanguineus]